jgi:hypothetical protein
LSRPGAMQNRGGGAAAPSKPRAPQSLTGDWFSAALNKKK